MAVEVDNTGIAVGFVVVGLLTLAQLAVALKTLMVRQPSVDKEFATKTELAAHVERNERDHKDIFSKLNGTERGWREQLLAISNQVSAVDDRSKQTRDAVTLLNQNLMEFMRNKGDDE